MEDPPGRPCVSMSDDFMAHITEQMIQNVEVKDRTYKMKKYAKCFKGMDAVRFLVSRGYARNDDDGVKLGNCLMEMGMFSHVTRDHPLKNEDLFYRFAVHEEKFVRMASMGEKVGRPAGGLRQAGWADALLRSEHEAGAAGLQPGMPEWDRQEFTQGTKDVNVSPLDEHNIKLLDNVHPAQWTDPVPTKEKYNLVVIGAGSGGLVTAAGSAGVGARVAIVEEHLLGGDCLNVGCVPSKAIIRCARAAYEARNAAKFGLNVPVVEVNFGAVMERMRKIRAGISRHDSAARFTGLGVDVFIGHAQFRAKDTVMVNGKALKFAACVIASGATASVPPIKGLRDVPYLTNASFFNLTELPKRFGVIGTGVIGLELAQCMARFGSQVTVMGRSGKILEKEERDAVEIIQKQLVEDGITFKLHCQYKEVKKPSNGRIEVHIVNNGKPEIVVVDELLVATGRTPNVRGLDLEKAGVEYDEKKGIVVNEYLQTTAKSIYAVGDCCTEYKFTHVADAMARTVIRNALFFGAGKMSSLLIPWATFTEPEVAHVGLYEADLTKKGIKFQSFVKKLSEVDRAICDGQEEGFVKITVKEGTDKILGATIVAHNAGDMISEVSLAMQSGFGLGSIAYVIHPYPTQAEAVRMCGDLYNKTRLTAFIRSMFRNLLAWRRS
ncbi:unnamed protein product [Ostreobium quekettii]|uniref:DEP domain-containing protein n=1 Tax=Ostreobium quekettii TaxID=121088 RepID=A0A8S1J1S5_9CHLO|nr:unnamed protein product [Ostreobium quekettii]